MLAWPSDRTLSSRGWPASSGAGVHPFAGGLIKLSLGAIDLSNLDAFVAGPPWDDFDYLRRHAPVHWNPEAAPNHGFWSLTRHADVLAVDRDPVTFSSERGAVSLEELDAEQLESRKSMIDTDGLRQALCRLLQATSLPAASRATRPSCAVSRPPLSTRLWPLASSTS